MGCGHNNSFFFFLHSFKDLKSNQADLKKTSQFRLNKSTKVICYQLKPLVMESSWHPMMAGMITYLSAISFNSLYIHAIGRPVCESKESFFSVINLMEAVRWSYQSHHNQGEIQLFNICHQNVLVLAEHLSRLKL